MALSIGLAGAGRHAAHVLAQALADGSGTRLAGVWSRCPDAALRLADRVQQLVEAAQMHLVGV